MPEFIYTMKDLRKVVPPKREILKGIWLSFYYGAKIGVLGANGAGKSSLLKIMAGLDQEFDGEAFAAKGAKVGHLPQEPELDPGKTVLENIEEGVAAPSRPTRARPGTRTPMAWVTTRTSTTTTTASTTSRTSSPPTRRNGPTATPT